MIFKYLAGFVIYTLGAIMAYSPKIKAHRLYFPGGMILSMLAGLSWLSIAKGESNPNQLVLLGMYWDSMFLVIYLVIPFVFFGAQVTWLQGLGIATIVLGIFLTKM